MSKMMRKKKQEVLYMGDDTGLYMEMQGAGFLEELMLLKHILII